jgi:hypothetical protein
MSGRVREYSIIILAFVLWYTPSVAQLLKYLGNWGMLAATAAELAVLTIIVKSWNTISSKQWVAIRTYLPIALVAAIIVLFAILYPIAKGAVLGAGSDRDDALNVALSALLRGSYPYHAVTFLGNQPTPAPGALLLAMPFFLLGNSAL